MKRDKIVIVFLIIIWLFIIFYFSHQDATESARLSGRIVAYLDWIESVVDMDLSLEQSIHNIIRKLAHFIEYFILGGLFYLLYEKMGISFVSTVICAIFDEVHQYFIPGRGPRVFDFIYIYS